MTDAELLATELVVDDPYAHGPVEETSLPEGVTIVDVINVHKYKHYKTGDKVFCCICGGCRHKYGFRVLRSDGLETLIGKHCAKPVLVESWDEAFLGLKQDLERKSYLQELANLRIAALNVVPKLRSYDMTAKILVKAHANFALAMPQLYEMLKRAADRGGELEATEKVRVVRRNDKSGSKDDKNDDGRVWDYIPVKFTLKGRNFIRTSDPTGAVSSARKAIQLIRDLSASTDTYSTSQIKRACVMARNRLSHLAELKDIPTAATAFFDVDNLQTIAYWVKLLFAEDNGRLRPEIAVENGRLVNLENGAVVMPSRFPDDFAETGNDAEVSPARRRRSR